MKSLFIATSITLLLSSSFAASSAAQTKPIETSKIEVELAKKSAPNMKLVYEELEQVAASLSKNFSANELERVLAFYEKINKIDNKHFYVEMFVGLYKSHKGEFEMALKKALSSEDQKEFMRKLKIAITESEEGNG